MDDQATPAQAQPQVSQAGKRTLEEGRMFLLFAAIGAGAFVIDAGVLTVGLHFGLTPAIARIVSLFVAMNATFVANRAFTFAKFRERPLPVQWALYMAANSIGAGVNYLVFLALTATLLKGQPVLAAAAGAVAGLAFNFTASRLTAFRR
jgi:putative flippase GtrA